MGSQLSIFAKLSEALHFARKQCTSICPATEMGWVNPVSGPAAILLARFEIPEGPCLPAKHLRSRSAPGYRLLRVVASGFRR